MLKKSLIFCAISYLVARLEWAFEISRLAILRLRPQPQIVEVAKHERLFADGLWVMGDTRDYFLHYSEQIEAPVLKALPEKIPN